MSITHVGIIGCGNISGIYIRNLSSLYRQMRITAVCDVLEARARDAVAELEDVKIYLDYHDIIQDPQVDIILNLTTPPLHFPVIKNALEAGKHVYTEKPLALTLEEGIVLSRLAREKGLSVGCSPDTVLGSGIQTCRKAIDGGFIGKPVAASAFMVCRGHELWHPEPGFYYQKGGGPLFDMGPYYIGSLFQMLGPISHVAAMNSRAFDERIIYTGSQAGHSFPVDVDTHLVGLLRFHSGAICTMTMSFDVWKTKASSIEVCGTEGTLTVPDPDCFSGDIELYRPETGVFAPLPDMFPYRERSYEKNCRGLGIAEMASAIRCDRKPRTDIEIGLHILEVLCAFEKSQSSGMILEMQTRPERPAPMDSDVPEGIIA